MPPFASSADSRATKPAGVAGHRLWWAVGGVSALAAAGVVAGLVSSRSDPGTAVDDPGPVHVHGMAVNPGDGDLYVATHTGLYRVDGPQSATRIGDRYQDTMGFIVAGPDRYLASGHPDMRDDTLQQHGKPPLLGLVESTDNGQTWQPLSLLGDSDLHTIVAVGDEIVAYDSTGQRVLVSSDDGGAWETRSSIALADLAVDPADTHRMVALSADGATLTSTDGGRAWSAPMPGPTLAVLRWSDRGLWGGASDGGLFRFDDSTGEWTRRHRFDGAVEAVFIDETAIYVAVDGSGIYRSPDDGSSWDPVFQPPSS